MKLGVDGRGVELLYSLALMLFRNGCGLRRLTFAFSLLMELETYFEYARNFLSLISSHNAVLYVAAI